MTMHPGKTPPKDCFSTWSREDRDAVGLVTDPGMEHELLALLF